MGDWTIDPEHGGDAKGGDILTYRAVSFTNFPDRVRVLILIPNSFATLL